MLSPVFIAVAILIVLTSPGPVFYRGIRIGKAGVPFRMLKFRTMVERADSLGGPSAGSDDPRITWAGTLLRKLKLDEFPQLFNVLLGQMSLVGPRPEVPEEVELYDENSRRLLLVRPGITDYASIRFRNEGEILKGAPDPHKAFKELIQPEKIRLGLKYVDNHSCIGDIKILILTIRAVISD